MILVSLCFLQVTKDVSGLCLKVGGKKHNGQGEGEMELRRGPSVECKKVLLGACPRVHTAYK